MNNNNNQTGDNKQDLAGQEAIDKIKELVDEAKSCFFCTNIRSGRQFTTRPMAVQEVDDEGNLWFLSADDSHKNEEMSEDPFVQLLFQGSSHSDFLSIYGKAYITRDKEKIDALWEPFAKTWFKEGKEDPRITVIKVETQNGYYWDTKQDTVVAFAKQVGDITGQATDDVLQGSINV